MQDVIYAAFKRVPPKFSSTGSSDKYNWVKHSTTPDPLDKIPPVAISQGEFRDDKAFLARRTKQIECGSDAASPLHLESVRFDAPRDGGCWAPGGHEKYCSCWSVGFHLSLSCLMPHYAMRPPIGRKPP